MEIKAAIHELDLIQQGAFKLEGLGIPADEIHAFCRRVRRQIIEDSLPKFEPRKIPRPYLKYETGPWERMMGSFK